MNRTHFRTLPLAAALTLAGMVGTTQAAESTRLMAAAPGDLVATQLVAGNAKASAPATLDRAPVSVSWALDPTESLSAEPQAHVAESREYWIDASESEIQNGVKLPTTAPGALVRLSPHDGTSAIVVDDVQLRMDGRALQRSAGIRSVADEEALRAAGMDVPSGSVVLRLADSVQGNVNLAVPTARGAYLVHVFEPASPVVLKLAAERDSVIGGDAITFRARIEGASLERIGGLVSAPDGASQQVDFVRQRDGSYLASVTPDIAHAGSAGLWEAHAFGVTGGKAAVPRDVRTAFAVSRPVARLDGSVAQLATGKEGGLSFRIGLEATAASRYAISGVLYGTDGEGQLRPVAVAQSAAWLEAGRRSLQLRYEAASLSLGAP